MRDEEWTYSVKCDYCVGKGYREADEEKGEVNVSLYGGYGGKVGEGIVCESCGGTGKVEIVEHYAVEG